MENFTYLHILTLLLYINLLQPTTVVSSFGNETDRFAFLKFKESIVSDPHGFLNSWNDSVHFCKWGGITCGRRHQRVTGLNLSDADLNGTISPYVGNLSFLRFISLPRNKFSGMIPQQVGQLFRPRLDLNTNMLEGGIPVNLTFCPELSVSTIGENRLKGDIPSEIGSLMKLVRLNLERNNLTGRVPPSFGNLSSLERLALGENNLVGTVPEEMGQLRNLLLFSINYGNLCGMLPPSLFNMSSMQIYSFTDNKFEGIVPLPPSIDRNMPDLPSMFLAGNEFSGQFPASISNASQLQELDLGDTYFVGQVPASLGNLPNLQFLSLEFNELGSNSSNANFSFHQEE